MASSSRVTVCQLSQYLAAEASGSNGRSVAAAHSIGRALAPTPRHYSSAVAPKDLLTAKQSARRARQAVLAERCDLGPRPRLRTFASSSWHASAWPAGHDAVPDEGRRKAMPSQASDGGTQSSSGSRARSAPFSSGERAVTMQDIADSKQRKEAIAVLTAYDYSSALSQRGAPVDICLVGDSLANVALGHRTTHALTLEGMIHHVQAVARGLRHAAFQHPELPPVPLLIADIPYGCGVETSVEQGVRTATALVKQGGADGVKIEGGDEVVPLVQRLASFGIPVMAHIGLQPQRASSGSALNLAGRTANEALSMLDVAKRLEHAGAFSVVLECIPARVGAALTRRLNMATIGIGAGSATDGQVLVADDVLGECTSPLHVLAGLDGHVGSSESDSRVAGSVDAAHPQMAATLPRPSTLTPTGPRFVRNFVGQITGGSSLGALRIAAVRAYVAAVKARSFPNDDVEAYKMKREEWVRLQELLQVWDERARPHV